MTLSECGLTYICSKASLLCSMRSTRTQQSRSTASCLSTARRFKCCPATKRSWTSVVWESLRRLQQRSVPRWDATCGIPSVSAVQHRERLPAEQSSIVTFEFFRSMRLPNVRPALASGPTCCWQSWRPAARSLTAFSASVLALTPIGGISHAFGPALCHGQAVCERLSAVDCTAIPCFWFFSRRK